MVSLEDGDVLVLDLDGTLIAYNSFHSWLIFLLKRGASYGCARLRWIVVKQLVLRALRLITHQQLKANIMALWSSVKHSVPQKAEAAAKEFATNLRKDFRMSLLKLLDEAHSKGVPCLLATAAPSDYASMLQIEGLFDVVLASEIHNGLLVENRYEQKAKAVALVCNSQGWDEGNIVFATDHADDISMCTMSKHVYWFGGACNWQDLSRNNEGLCGEVCV